MLRIHVAACRSICNPVRWILHQPRALILLKVQVARPSLAQIGFWQSYRFQSSGPVKNSPQKPEIRRSGVKIESGSELKPIEPVSVSETAKLADLLKDIYTVPNILTMTRIASTPFIGYFIASSHSTAAISLFTYLCVTDFADGYIARRYNLKSVLGSILDPLADKFLMTTCTVALYIGGGMPLYAASIIIGRDVMLSFMAFYMRYKSLPAPRTVQRYFDPKVTTHTVLPNTLGKVNTALQMFYIGGLVLLPGLEQLLTLPFDTIFSWYGMVVAGTTLASGASYLFSRGSARIPVK